MFDYKKATEWDIEHFRDYEHTWGPGIDDEDDDIDEDARWGYPPKGFFTDEEILEQQKRSENEPVLDEELPFE